MSYVNVFEQEDEIKMFEFIMAQRNFLVNTTYSCF